MDGATLHDKWRARGLQLGMTVEGLEAVTGRDRYRSLNVTGRREIAERLSSATGLTQRASTFGQREVIQAWCDQLRQGGDVAEVLKLASFYLASPQHVVPVGKATELRGTDVIRREDGKTVAAQTDEYRFSTPEMLETERRLVAAAVERSGTGVAVATAGAVARAIENRPYLSDEQARMVTTVASGGDGVVLVVGRPGAGKTTALGACREAWEASGHRVVGCALAAETARTLQRESGIESYTVTQLMADISDPEHGGLARNSVVVVDEAAMVGTRQLAPLLEAAQRGGAKVVLVGDDHQLPEIDAGGAFRGLRDRTTSVELIENRRQREAWERNALERLRSGDVARAIAEYQGRDAVVVGANADEVRRQLVQDWWAARQQATDPAAQPVIIAARHVDVDRLNDQARAMRKAGGELGEASLEIAGREFAAGDRVVTMKNARGLGVRNGTRGTVTEIDQEKRRLTVRTDDGVDVELPESYAARRLRHAYALTGHKAQGKTVTRAFVLADDATYREWAYTALSRGQEANRLYVVRRESQLPDDLTHGTERSRVRCGRWCAASIGVPPRRWQSTLPPARRSTGSNARRSTSRGCATPSGSGLRSLLLRLGPLRTRNAPGGVAARAATTAIRVRVATSSWGVGLSHQRQARPPIPSTPAGQGWPPRRRGCSPTATVAPAHPQRRRSHTAPSIPHRQRHRPPTGTRSAAPRPSGHSPGR